ncbi:MAG: hypothetical protein ABW101_09330 [Candidatus Thiodiazotropha sp.]
MKIIFTYAALWLVLAVIAILNGGLREKFYAPLMNELTAHQLSTFSAIVLFSLCIWIFTGLWPIASARQAVTIGMMWLAMTVAFEFVFGHFVMGHSWERLFHDYNILRGRVWILVLIWTSVAPYLFYRFRS